MYPGAVDRCENCNFKNRPEGLWDLGVLVIRQRVRNQLHESEESHKQKDASGDQKPSSPRRSRCLRTCQGTDIDLSEYALLIPSA